MILTLNRCCYYLSFLFVLLSIKTVHAQPKNPNLQLTFLTNLANLRDHLLQGSQDSLVDFSQTFEVVDEAIVLLKEDGKLSQGSNPEMARIRRLLARSGKWVSPSSEITLSDYGLALYEKYAALYYFRELGLVERKYPFQIPADLPMLREVAFYDLKPHMRILELNHDACPLWLPIGLTELPVKFIRMHGKACDYYPQHRRTHPLFGYENHIPWLSQELSYEFEKRKIHTQDSLDRIICNHILLSSADQMNMLKAGRKLLKSDGLLIIQMAKGDKKTSKTNKEMKRRMRLNRFILIDEHEEPGYTILKYRKR